MSERAGAAQAGPAPGQGDTQRLLEEGQEVASSSSCEAVEQQSAGGPQGRSLAGFLGWLRGRRPADAQPVPSEDDEEGSELGEVSRRPPQVAVVVEPPAAAAAAAAAATSQQQQQQQQQQAVHVQQQQQSTNAGAEGEASTSSVDAASSSASGGGGDEIQPRPAPSSPRAVLEQLGSIPRPTCLVCLDDISQDQLVSGAALRLECNCRGDLALRHRDCALKWVQVKGSNVCELCKAPIRNIPPPPPRPSEADLPQLDEAYFHDPAHIHDFMPSSQDLVFDCIRVTWVAMIVSILFFDMNLGAALWTGLLAGFAYSVMVRLMYRSHFYAMQRLAEQQAAARREAESEAAVGAPPVAAVV